jgi:hypothetical protein
VLNDASEADLAGIGGSTNACWGAATASGLAGARNSTPDELKAASDIAPLGGPSDAAPLRCPGDAGLGFAPGDAGASAS